MRYLTNRILCVLLLSGGLTSCHNNDRYYSHLLSFERSVNNAPEEIIDSLKTIDTVRLSRKAKALYYIILVRGLELSGELPRNDSILAYSFSYYTKHKEDIRLAQLYYLQGEIYRKGKFLIQAMESFYLADKYAKGNKKLQYRLNIEMAGIYRHKLMEQEEDSCLKKAFDLAVELADSMKLSEVYRNLSLSHINRRDYGKGKLLLNRAIDRLPAGKYGIISGYYEEMSQIYISLQKADSALYYVNRAIGKNTNDEKIFEYNLLKGDIFLTMHRLDSAECYVMQDTNKLSLNQKMRMCQKMYRIKKKTGWLVEADAYLEKHVAYRDSLDLIRKEYRSEQKSNMQAYKRQREKASQAEMELAENTVAFYKLIVVSLLIIFILMTISFYKERRKRKLEQQLKDVQLSAMEIRAKQQDIELQLSTEREEQEKMKISKLNQTVDYYKSLNAITIPALLKKQKGTMLHLTEEEWNMVVRNTDACFDRFTERLKKQYVHLTEEEIRFCCLVKMELSIVLLANIYHIAGGSVSRKKMRLKEKLGLENMSLDEFIRGF